MASSGPNFPSDYTAVIGGSGGFAPWINPNYITADDTNYATAAWGETCDIEAEITEQLQGLDYGFAIPGTATIDGIEVKINRMSDISSAMSDNFVSLIKAASVVGDDKATGSFYPTSFAEAIYGGASDLWGTTWTPSQINAVDFGVAFESYVGASGSAAYVDYIKVTVYYTDSSGSGSGVNGKFFLLF